jgi:hypothetical protein
LRDGANGGKSVLRVAFIDDDGRDETHMGCLVNDLWDLRQSRSSSPPRVYQELVGPRSYFLWHWKSSVAYREILIVQRRQRNAGG